MSSSADAAIPVLIRVPADLLARVDRLADQQERSRSWIMRRAAVAFCDAIAPSSIPPTGIGGDAEAGRSGEAPGSAGALSVPRACSSLAGSADGGRASEVMGPRPAAAYPANLHLDAVRRVGAVAAEREATARQHRDRVEAETAAALKGIPE